MPAKNASTTIADSIRSILSIPLVSELIVVDDRSTDETVKIVRGFDDERIRIILGPGAGISAAINCGIKASSCEYIARCDADDLYPQDRFEWQIDWLNDNDGYVAISGGFSTIDSEGRAVADLACDGVAGDVTMRLLEGDAVTSFCSWLTRKTALDEVGGAREWFVTAEDLDLMFRLASRGRVWHEPRVAYLYRLHGNSIVHSQSNNQRQFYESSAIAFAKSRRQGYGDPLTEGIAPPAPFDVCAPALSVSEQISGYLVGAAWSAHAKGDRRTAWVLIARALKFEPTSLALWKNLLFICLKRTPR